MFGVWNCRKKHIIILTEESKDSDGEKIGRKTKRSPPRYRCMSGSEEGNWSKKLIMYIIGFVGFEDETSSFSEIDAFFIQFLKGWHTYHQCFRLPFHATRRGNFCTSHFASFQFVYLSAKTNTKAI